MKPRVVVDRTSTPEGVELELAIEQGAHVLRVGGAVLMSSRMRGSEEAMASFALEAMGRRPPKPRILIGGLGMGFTLRATLDVFPDAESVCVAELLPAVVAYNRGPLGELAGRPLDDPQVEIFEGDVRDAMSLGRWDLILLDVDNGPDPLTMKSNRSLYSLRGVRRAANSLAKGGLLVVWSAAPSSPFETRLRTAGLEVITRAVRARWPARKGPTHTLFLARNET